MLKRILIFLCISCLLSYTALGDAAADACRDIRDGCIRLMQAGTFAIYTPGVDLKDKRFDKIPRKTLPSGCTNPKAAESIKYAEEYNAVMIPHILSSQKTKTKKP